MHTISLDETDFPLSNAGPEAEKAALDEFKLCLGKEEKLFRRIQRAGNAAGVQSRADAYFSSPACRYVAMVKQARDLDTEKRLPLTVYRSLAKQLSLFKPITEPTEYWDKPKSKGGTRRIHDFGPMNRAAQHMVMRVISAIFKPRPFQYNVAGRGPSRAVFAIKQKIGEGFRQLQKLDVKSFFDSFSRESIYQLLPLPTAVIDNVLMPDNLQLKPKKGAKSKPGGVTQSLLHSSSSFSSLPVLPQGSLHANILAEHAIALMGIALPKDAEVFIFVDDILIVAKSATALQVATHALLSAYGDSPAGTFKFTMPDDGLLSGIDFLGYRIQQLPGGKLMIGPSPDNWKELAASSKKLKTAITKASNKGFGHTATLEQAIVAYYVYLRSWVAGFRAADDLKLFVQNVQQGLVAICRSHGVSVAKIKELAQAPFSHKTAKLKSKNGGYKWEIEITKNDPFFDTFDNEA